VGLNNLLAAYIDKSAAAICTFAYCPGPGCEVLLFEGICEVTLPWSSLCVYVPWAMDDWVVGGLGMDVG